MRKWVMIHLTQSESKRFLKKNKEKKEKTKQFWCISIRREQAGGEHSANETALFNSFFTTFHSQIKSGLSPQLNFKWHSKYPQKLLARDQPPYQKRQHETNATRRRKNKCYTVPPAYPCGTVIARLESNRLLWWIINVPNSLELSKCWSVIALVSTLY